jgi:hypothetical protein
MIAFQRGLGVKIPITGTNWTINGAVTRAQHVTDFNDGHSYFSWGRFDATARRINDVALTQQQGIFGRLAFNRLPDKPYFVSEWDMLWPCDYRAESPILMAAVGCLQNWAGYTIHTYAYSNRHTPYQPLGLEVSSRSIGNGYHRQGQFATWNDPAKFGVFYHASLIMRRGDMRPAVGSVAIKVDDLRLRNTEAMDLLAEHTRVGTEYEDVPARSPQTHLGYNDAAPIDAAAREADYFGAVDWGGTQAYGLGINSLYLNLAGREPEGCVRAEDKRSLQEMLRTRLQAAVDPRTGERPIYRVYRPEEIYTGPMVDKAPDLIIGYSPNYRASWDTVLGKYPREVFLDNLDPWSGDHCIDAAFMAGCLFSNRRFTRDEPALEHLAPAIIRALCT